MAEIVLKSGEIVLIDEADLGLLSDHEWRFCPRSYVYSELYLNGRRARLKMHRLILSAPDGLVVDHKNHNPLDNRRSNLRLCTQRQNTFNRRLYKSNTSGYKGVTWDADRLRWTAHIKYDSSAHKRLGRFKDPVQAAIAYDEAAKKYHGEFAVLNFPNGATA